MRGCNELLCGECASVHPHESVLLGELSEKVASELRDQLGELNTYLDSLHSIRNRVRELERKVRNFIGKETERICGELRDRLMGYGRGLVKDFEGKLNFLQSTPVYS